MTFNLYAFILRCVYSLVEGRSQIETELACLVQRGLWLKRVLCDCSNISDKLLRIDVGKNPPFGTQIRIFPPEKSLGKKTEKKKKNRQQSKV